MTTYKVKVAVLGASGYTGSEFVRLALGHPHINLVALSANTQAGKAYAEIFPSFLGVGLPDLVTTGDVDYRQVDVVVLCLPHTKSQEVISSLWDAHPHLRFVDLAADFRLSDPGLYAATYSPHLAPALQPHAVYGLSEHNAEAIAAARLVACPGCFPTGALSLLLPLLNAQVIEPEGIILDAKTGVTGAGRKVDQAFLFAELNDSVHAYGISGHRHRPEMEQEIARACNRAPGDTAITFVPTLAGQNRGILTNAYLRLAAGKTLRDARDALARWASQHPMLAVADNSAHIATRYVRGTNRVMIGVFAGRSDRALVGLSAIDNLTKGSSGQALQNINLMYGFPVDLGLNQTALFP